MTGLRYDVVVIGGGLSACEAAHAAAQMGCETLLLAADLGHLADQARLLERQHVDFRGTKQRQRRQRDFCVVLQCLGLKATLGQATLQRHLTAFETDLVVAARTRLLTLVTATGGLAQAGADATADTALGMLGTRCGLDAVEFHDVPLTAECLTAPGPGNGPW